MVSFHFRKEHEWTDILLVILANAYMSLFLFLQHYDTILGSNHSHSPGLFPLRFSSFVIVTTIGDRGRRGESCRVSQGCATIAFPLFWYATH